MDVLSDVLKVSSLGNVVLSQQQFEPPWSMEVGPKVRAAVHIVKRGVCWFWISGGASPMRLHPGDLVFIPGGATHVIGDDPRTPPRPFTEVLVEQAMRREAGEVASASGCALVCVQLTFDQQETHPLLSVLPDVIHLPADSGSSDDSLRSISRLLVRESAQPDLGADLIVPRLIDTLVVLIVRHWLATHPFEHAGWLGALRDPQVAKSLGLMHGAPERPWTIEVLANNVAMSRAAFARRFSTLVGEPPLTYLTRWRMSLAAKRLKVSEDGLDAIATAVGYESVTAFASAFRRHFALAPGRYRASHRAY